MAGAGRKQSLRLELGLTLEPVRLRRGAPALAPGGELDKSK